MPGVVLFDLEFTTWDGALAGGWTAPGQLREIVQIGALRLGSDLEVLEEFETLVRPLVNPQLSDYFTRLTGITQAEVDVRGSEVATALDAFLAFCADDVVLSYGNDMVVLGENHGWARARSNSLRRSILAAKFINIRPWVNATLPETSSAHVGRLWEVLRLPRPVAGDEHSAVFDCYSLAAALRHARESGFRLPPGCGAACPPWPLLR